VRGIENAGDEAFIDCAGSPKEGDGNHGKEQPLVQDLAGFFCVSGVEDVDGSATGPHCVRLLSIHTLKITHEFA
jgi:hypothetical protein